MLKETVKKFFNVLNITIRLLHLITVAIVMFTIKLDKDENNGEGIALTAFSSIIFIIGIVKFFVKDEERNPSLGQDNEEGNPILMIAIFVETLCSLIIPVLTYLTYSKINETEKKKKDNNSLHSIMIISIVTAIFSCIVTTSMSLHRFLTNNEEKKQDQYFLRHKLIMRKITFDKGIADISHSISSVRNDLNLCESRNCGQKAEKLKNQIKDLKSAYNSMVSQRNGIVSRIEYLDDEMLKLTGANTFTKFYYKLKYGPNSYDNLIEKVEESRDALTELKENYVKSEETSKMIEYIRRIMQNTIDDADRLRSWAGSSENKPAILPKPKQQAVKSNPQISGLSSRLPAPISQPVYSYQPQQQVLYSYQQPQQPQQQVVYAYQQPQQPQQQQVVYAYEQPQQPQQPQQAQQQQVVYARAPQQPQQAEPAPRQVEPAESDGESSLLSLMTSSDPVQGNPLTP